MRYYRLSGMLAVALFVFVSCDQKPRGIWQEGMISVMADKADWEGIQGPLRSTYEKIVRTPQPEYRYRLYHVPDSLIDHYSRARFLIVAATLKSTGRIGEMVRNVVADSVIRKNIENGENFVFIRRNHWAQDQYMMILVSKDLPMLIDKIESHSIMLYDLIEDEYKRVLTREVLYHRENEELVAQLKERYGWMMRMEKDYFLAEAFPEDQFLWMRRLSPDRWIFVRWIDNADTSLLNQDWVINERNRIGSTYYHNFKEQVSDQYLFSKKTTFLGRPAVITTGLWERIDDAAGGPFENYTFYDSPTGRLFMIDIALFVPGKDKMPYLRRMEVMVESFKTLFDWK